MMRPAPAVPPAAPRRRRRLYWSLALLTAFLIGGAIVLPWLLYHFEHGRLEKEAGPLRSARFARPKLPPSNPTGRMLEAASWVRLVGTENENVAEGTRRGLGRVRPDRAQYAVLLERNRDALSLALALKDDGPSSLNIDYAALSPPIPKLFRQLQLARLVYLYGLFALEEHDEGGVAAAARSLGVQAILLQREHMDFLEQQGLVAERFQLSLLQAFVQEAPGGRETGLDQFLVSSDLRSQYRATITWNASDFIQDIDQVMAGPAGEEDESTPAQAVAGALGRAFGRWRLEGRGAAALGRFRLYLRAYDEDYAWMHRELGKDPKKMSIWEKQGSDLCINDERLPALLRATAASRVLMASCLGIHSGRLTCEDANQVSRDGVRLRSSRRPDGTCVVRTADGQQFLRIFRRENTDPIPQNCSVLTAR